MKNNNVKIHLLSLVILTIGFIVANLVMPMQSGFGNRGKMIAIFTLVILCASFLMNGKVVPLITSSGFLVTFFLAFIFQKDSLDPAGARTNNFSYIWVFTFLGCFALSLFFEAAYANKKLS